MPVDRTLTTESGEIKLRKVLGTSDVSPYSSAEESDQSSIYDEFAREDKPVSTDGGEQSSGPVSPNSHRQSSQSGTLSEGGQSPALNRMSTSGSDLSVPASAGGQKSIVSQLSDVMALKLAVFEAISTGHGQKAEGFWVLGPDGESEERSLVQKKGSQYRVSRMQFKGRRRSHRGRRRRSGV